jgi:hypothetical protein
MDPAIDAGLKIIAETASIVAGVQSDKNAPDVKVAKEAQDEIDAVDAETRAVAEHDIETIRKNLAE